MASVGLAAVLYFAPDEARAQREAELGRPFRHPPTERVLDNSAAAGRVIILDNRLLSNGWGRTLDSGNQIAPNEPLTRAIRSGMNARAIAGLRIAEGGRKLLEEGDYSRALVRFERSLGFDSNPYSYYYLALIHYRLGRYQQALNFIEVAESQLHDHSAWMAELSRLTNVVRHAFRSAQVQHNQEAMTKAAALGGSEAKPQAWMETAGAVDGVVARHYLVLFDLLLLSVSTLVFFAAISTRSDLRAR
jgi:tetratricopeptide (TPR) repeat protein